MNASRKPMFFLLVAIVFAAGWIGIAYLRKDPLSKAFYLVDSDVPGTEIYFRDRLLGTVPVWLSKRECLNLRLIESTNVFLDTDGWGEGIPFSDLSSNTHMRVMFKAPSLVESNYFIYETPWGTRTKNGGGYLYTNGIRSIMMSKSEWPKGFSIQIDLPKNIAVTEESVKITAFVKNAGTNLIAGLRPQLTVLCRTFDVQWQNCECHKFSLPGEWSQIGPGQMMNFAVNLPIPKAAGDYSVFATLDLFEDKTTENLAYGSFYTDSKLLHIR